MGIPKPPHTDGPLAPEAAFVKTLKKNVPELWRLASLEIRATANKDSSQLTPHDWIRLAEAIAGHYEEYDAFIITHGTDTMAFTGAALSYLLPYPCKPVVITGSQKPLGEIRTDARRNLINAVAVAASQRICEVAIFFDTLLLRANRAKKVHIEEYRTFDSPNFHWLAEERLKTRFTKPVRESLNRPRLNPAFDSRVQVVKAFPGARPTLARDAKAVIIEAFGCGNLPVSDAGVLHFLRACSRKRVPVVMVSQVPAGSLTPEIYEMGRQALELGAISTRDMTFEAALVKCMMLAANEVPYEHWPACVQANWAGEVTPLA
jgi:L-asparaginase